MPTGAGPRPPSLKGNSWTVDSRLDAKGESAVRAQVALAFVTGLT
jgi:hypothetical protein